MALLFVLAPGAPQKAQAHAQLHHPIIAQMDQTRAADGCGFHAACGQHNHRCVPCAGAACCGWAGCNPAGLPSGCAFRHPSYDLQPRPPGATVSLPRPNGGHAVPDATRPAQAEACTARTVARFVATMLIHRRFTRQGLSLSFPAPFLRPPLSERSAAP